MSAPSMPDFTALVTALINAVVSVIDAVVDAISANAQVIGGALVAFGILGFIMSQLRGMPLFGWVRKFLPL